jgi:hypothetical protein
VARVQSTLGLACSTTMIFMVPLAAAPTAAATAPIGVNAVVLAKQTVAGKDYIVSDITIALTAVQAGMFIRARSSTASSRLEH